MPYRAFVPAALVEAQPRVYRSFRGRQLKGLLMGAGGAGLVLILIGARDLTGYVLAFLAALPGFAYGYYQPQGRPVEYWLQVYRSYYTKPQRITAARPPRMRPALLSQIGPVLRVLAFLIRNPRLMRRERQPVGRE
jgi:hypothetical protein